MDALTPLLCVLSSLLITAVGQSNNLYYNMNELSTCDQTAIVYDREVTVHAQNEAGTPNPQTECILYLQSGYIESDGYYRLQIIIEVVDIRDSAVFLDIFNGRGTFTNYLRRLGSNSASTDTLYTKDSEATLRFTRPPNLYRPEYKFTLKIKAYRDVDAPGAVTGVSKLSPAGIIGIVVGLLVLLILAFLIGWCIHTGKLAEYVGRSKYGDATEKQGVENEAMSVNAGEEKTGFDIKDPVVWNTITTGQYTPNSTPKESRRQFRQGHNRGLPAFARENKLQGNATENLEGNSVKLNIDSQGQRAAAWRRDGGLQNGQSFENNTRKAPVYDDVYESREGYRKTEQMGGSMNGRQRDIYANGQQVGGRETAIDDPAQDQFRRGQAERGSRQSTGSKRGSFNEKDKKQTLGNEEGSGSFQRGEHVRGSRQSTSSKRASFNDGKRRSLAGNDEETDVKKKPYLDDEVAGKRNKRPSSGLFENPDQEGYLYDYDHLQSLSGSEVDNLGQQSTSGRGQEGNKRLMSETRPPGMEEGRSIVLPEATATMTAPQHPPGAPSESFSEDDYDRRGYGRNQGIGMSDTPGPDSLEIQSELGDMDSISNAPNDNTADKSKHSPGGKRKKKKGDKSNKRPGRGILGSSLDPLDPDAMPPEASEPVFTTPLSSDPYTSGAASMGYGPYGAPNYAAPNYGAPTNGAPVFMPYGMVPLQPGMQTYAYAYQTSAPPGSAPDQPMAVTGQAAWFMQSVPTQEGPIQKTAVMMATTQSPSHPGSRHGSFKHKNKSPYAKNPGNPDYSSTPAGALDTPKRSRRSHPKRSPYDPNDDMSILPFSPDSRPNDSGHGHKSAAMKSAVDPYTGVHTTQVLWTDTVPDPTDPPGSNPQITRKTVTRVTTRSGHSDLPSSNAMAPITDYLQLEPEEPAFLSPSSQRGNYSNPYTAPAITQTPEQDNVAYYMGLHNSHHPGAPPQVIHDATSRNKAIRDRITLREAEA